MLTALICLQSITAITVAASVYLNCRRSKAARQAHKMVAEIEHTETIDRIVYSANHLTAPEVEQRARVAVNREAMRILRAELGDGYDAWVTQAVLDRLTQAR